MTEAQVDDSSNSLSDDEKSGDNIKSAKILAIKITLTRSRSPLIQRPSLYPSSRIINVGLILYTDDSLSNIELLSGFDVADLLRKCNYFVSVKSLSVFVCLSQFMVHCCDVSEH